MFGLKLENAHTPWWIRLSIPLAIWRVRGAGQQIYLTFDDGPTPGVTNVVLDQLNELSAKATFFCQAQQVRKHPELFQRILNEGHAVGNHGSSHLNGWQTPTFEYLDDVFQAAEIIKSHAGFESLLFRPPFGRLGWSAMLRLPKKYRIVMWDSMSMDYRQDLETDVVAQNVIRSAGNGSIVLWHDSELAAKHVLVALPTVLNHFSQCGFRFSALNDGRSCGSTVRRG